MSRKEGALLIDMHWALAGELPLNHGILREIASLCGRLPLVNSHEFNKSFTMVWPAGLALGAARHLRSYILLVPALVLR
jgi:hypothetical protein